MPVQVHLGIDVVLDGLNAQLFEARHLPTAQQFRGHVGEGRTAPESERLGEQSDRKSVV